MAENIPANTPAPDPKTNGRRHTTDTTSDTNLDIMFEMTIGQHHLMQDNIEHSLEISGAWG